jgi:hypothetical protein
MKMMMVTKKKKKKKKTTKKKVRLHIHTELTMAEQG